VEVAAEAVRAIVLAAKGSMSDQDLNFVGEYGDNDFVEESAQATYAVGSTANSPPAGESAGRAHATYPMR
jgi:hypothetical protein